MFSGKLSALPLSDDYIVAQSVRLFREKEPCIIYRSFIRNKALLALDDFFREAAHGNRAEILWEEIPDSIREMLPSERSLRKISVSL